MQQKVTTQEPFELRTFELPSNKRIKNKLALFATYSRRELWDNDSYQQLVEEVRSWERLAKNNPVDVKLLSLAVVCTECNCFEVKLAATKVLGLLSLSDAVSRLAEIAVTDDLTSTAIRALLDNNHSSSHDELIKLIPKLGSVRSEIYVELAQRGCRAVIPELIKLLPQAFSEKASRSDCLGVAYEYQSIFYSLRLLDAREASEAIRSLLPESPMGFDPALIAAAELLAFWDYEDIPKSWLICDYYVGRRAIESEVGEPDQRLREMRSTVEKDWAKNKTKYWGDEESERFELFLIEHIFNNPMTPSNWLEQACRHPYFIRRTSKRIYEKFKRRNIPAVMQTPELSHEFLSLDLLSNDSHRGFSTMHALGALGLDVHQMPGTLADTFVRRCLRLVDKLVDKDRTRLKKRLDFRPGLHAGTHDSEVSEFEVEDLIQNGLPTLSQLQRIVVGMIFEGHSLVEIGAKLNLNERTIRRHRNEIRDKISAGDWLG